ncbi:MAG: S8 family peptidase [Cyclobacteriaceae bacterium]|nr:MAG: S8 family peptidase [Cyclobacteriaceae bacterium]
MLNSIAAMRSLFLFSFMVISMTIDAQNNYFYYYKGQKINLTLEKNFLNIIPRADIEKSSMAFSNFRVFDSASDDPKITKIEFHSEPTDAFFFEAIQSIKQNSDIANVALYFKKGENSSIGTSDIFYIKLKDRHDFDKLQQVAAQRNVKIEKQVPNMPLWYLLSLNPDAKEYSFEAANFFYETGLFEDVDPAFIFDFKSICTNDPMFGSLWGLNNSSNPNIDINACQAWSISLGAGTTVAIVDTGIAKTHSDLAANISPISFNCETGTSPSGIPRIHGTHVAGIVGAAKNNLHVVGVAPQSKLMSISHSLEPLARPNMSAELASGISFAWQNGADVINNSWGDQGGIFYYHFHSAILENSIIDAMTLGRNGRGTVVVFGAGNHGYYGPVINYPANFHDDILTVGAITATGVRSIFQEGFASGYGSKLDVVAPGSGIRSTVPGDSTSSFSGTSMASPHVAGIAALMLSANPNLSRCQVINIIEATSQKVGSYSYSATTGRPHGTWNNEMGYGLVDAFAAVQAAQNMVSGPAVVCTSGAQFTLNNVPPGLNVTWSVSPAYLTTSSSGTGTTAYLQAYSGVKGQATLTYQISGGGTSECGFSLPYTRTKSLWIGLPNGGISGPSSVYPGQNYFYYSATPPHVDVSSGYAWELYGAIFMGLNYDFCIANWIESGIVAMTSQNACGFERTELNVEVTTEGGCNPCHIVYPNPADESFNVSVTDYGTTELRLYNDKQELVYLSKPNSPTTAIPVNNLPQGTYYLNIINKEGVLQRKVIVKR